MGWREERDRNFDEHNDEQEVTAAQCRAISSIGDHLVAVQQDAEAATAPPA